MLFECRRMQSSLSGEVSPFRPVTPETSSRIIADLRSSDAPRQDAETCLHEIRHQLDTCEKGHESLVDILHSSLTAQVNQYTVLWEAADMFLAYQQVLTKQHETRCIVPLCCQLAVGTTQIPDVLPTTTLGCTCTKSPAKDTKAYAWSCYGVALDHCFGMPFSVSMSGVQKPAIDTQLSTAACTAVLLLLWAS